MASDHHVQCPRHVLRNSRLLIRSRPRQTRLVVHGPPLGRRPVHASLVDEREVGGGAELAVEPRRVGWQGKILHDPIPRSSCCRVLFSRNMFGCRVPQCKWCGPT